MTIRAYYGLSGVLTNNIDSVATALPVSQNILDSIGPGFVDGVDFTYLSIGTGGLSEVVRVTAVVGGVLIVDRAQNGTTALPHPVGAYVEYVVTAEAIVQDIADKALIVQPPINGGGIVSTSQSPAGTLITVANPNFSGQGGVYVQGAWPNITFGYNPPENECCPGDSGSGGGGGGTTFYGQGVVEVEDYGNEVYINVDSPAFSGSGGIQVTGSWPYYTIGFAGGGVPSGTVTSVAASSGLQITGNPSVNPTLSITNTGVVAGDYSGFVVNPRGQITQIPPGFAPISTVEGTDGTITSTRTGGVVKLDVVAAAVGQPGVVALADETDPFDPADITTVATPAVVALAMESLALPELSGASSYLGESDGLYINTVTSSATAVSLLAGEKAIVYAECTVIDGTPATAPIYGIAVFSAAPARLKSNRILPQCTQNMSFVLEGPINTSIALVTTALDAGDTLVSWSMWVTKI